MKRLVLIIMLLAVGVFTAFGQDQEGRAIGGGDGGGDQDDGGGGNGGIQLQQLADPLKQLKETLALAKITLTRDQEKALQPAIDETIKAMQEMATAAAQNGAGAGADNRGRGGNRGGGAPPEGGRGRGGRGGAGRGGIAVLANPRMRELNNQFEAKLEAIMKPGQVAAWGAYRKEQIRKAGGLAALKIVLEDAKAPALSPEQEQQIGALYAELNRNRVRLAVQSGGQADPAKTKELETTTTAQVLRALSADQRKAMLESIRAQVRPNRQE